MIADLIIAHDHRAYAGHFPGMPILPGAALLDEVLEAIARARAIELLDWQVSSVKFQGIVSPGDALELQHDASGAATIRFSVRSGERTVATGVLSTITARSEAANGP